MITNNFNKELRGISDALRDLGYTDSTIGLRQRYWKEYCFFHGSLDIDEASMDEFLLKNYDIQSGNINVSKRQYEVRAALRNLLEYRRYGKIRNYHTSWFKDLPWVESFRAITEDFISHLRSQNSKPETIVNYERTLKRITNHLHNVLVLNEVITFCGLAGQDAVVLPAVTVQTVPTLPHQDTAAKVRAVQPPVVDGDFGSGICGQAVQHAAVGSEHIPLIVMGGQCVVNIRKAPSAAEFASSLPDTVPIDPLNGNGLLDAPGNLEPLPFTAVCGKQGLIAAHRGNTAAAGWACGC